MLTIAEGNTEASVYGEDVEVRRSPQAVACRKRYVGEPGKPRRAPDMATPFAGHTVIEARRGNPDTGLDRSLSGGKRVAMRRWVAARRLHARGVSYQA